MGNTKTENENTKTTQEKKEIRIDDSVLLKVKSNVYGKLFYKNLKTGEATEWDGAGDIQIMSVGDLRAMRATQTFFFKEHYILIIGVADGERCKATVSQILDALLITKYYNNYVEPADLRAVCSWSEAEIEEKIPMMSGAIQENLLVALNEFIKEGTLDSIRKIKAFERALGKELLSIDK